MSTFRDDLVAAIPSLKGWAFRLTKNADSRDELVQVTLCKALSKEHLFQPGTDLGAWARKIMFRLFLDERRRDGLFVNSAPVEDFADLLVSDMPNGFDAVRRRDFWRAVEDLSEAKAGVLLGVLHGYSGEELSARFGVPDGTIKSRTHRAMHAVRSAVSGEAA